MHCNPQCASTWFHGRPPGGEGTSSWIAPNLVSSPLTPTAGAFSVTRSAGVVRTYLRVPGSEWMLFNAGVTNGAAAVLSAEPRRAPQAPLPRR